MKEFLLSTPADYKVMSQSGVKQYVFPLDSIHNAIWDVLLPCSAAVWLSFLLSY